MSEISQTFQGPGLVAPAAVTDVAELLTEFQVPDQFAGASLDNYKPDPDQPSQRQALEHIQAFAKQVQAKPKRTWLSKNRAAKGIYLDGGFGVGKTHLLAALVHEVGEQYCLFGSFVAYTHLVGAMGFSRTIQSLSAYRLLCIDEFELDDPGDTVLMSRLIRELSDRGVWLAATSNTLPESLGEGRFAAQDFIREIQALSQRFSIYRIEGPDYRARHTDLSTSLPQHIDVDVTPGDRTAVITWPKLLELLADVHPSSYGKMLRPVEGVVITDLSQLQDQNMALRFVSFVDRLYDRQISTTVSTQSLDNLGQLYPETMLLGGYRKKYLRSLSRLSALLSASF